MLRKSTKKEFKTRSCNLDDLVLQNHLLRKIHTTIDFSFIYDKVRKIYCEGNFGIMKENHNLRITRRRGIQNVLNQCLFSVMALNIKKLLKYGNLLTYNVVFKIAFLSFAF